MDPNPPTTTMTNPRREIVHRGQLQRKVSQKYGTLFRKKKNVYEDELWVVLCVHDGGTGGIPHLEWYGELRFILEHRPLKVEDLLDCQYVNVAIGEERCLVIGFADKTRPVLELSAPSIEERKQWVEVLTRTLRRLNCLIESDEQSGNDGGGPPRAENEYIGFAGSPPEPSTSASGVGIPDPERQNEENVIECPHVPLSPIPCQQVQALSMDTNGTATPTSSRRTLGLKDPIPLMHSNSTSSTTASIAGPSTSSVAAESLKTRPIQASTSLPSESSDRHHYSTPIKPKLTRQPVQQTPIAVAPSVSDEIERREEEEESPEPPPLPPRSVKNTLSLSTSIPRIPTSPIPSSPPQKLSQYDVIGQQPSTALSSRSQYDQLCPPHSNGKSHPPQQQQPYQQISSRFSSELSDHYGSSSRSSCSSARISVSDHRLSQEPQEDDPQPSAQYNFPSNSPIPRQFLSPEHIFRESLSRPRRICFWLALLAEHVAFVELREKVWIAGWNPKVDSNLRDILNFGDEVEQINGVELRSVKQLPEIYANIKPGVQIELTLRSNPRMKVFTLTKPAGNPKRELGIVLHRGKNKIASIDLRSVADRAGISATMPAYYYHPTTNNTGTLKQKKQQQRVAAGDAAADDRSVRAVISQLNGVPLSPFSRGDQFFHRIDQLPTGSPLNLTLLPADFCSLLARQLKVQLKDWRRFVHDM